MSVNITTTQQHSISLCSVYAHKDTLLQQELEKHLNPLMRSGFISLRYVDQIVPGNKSAVEIERHLNMAQIILLLISADFFASDDCNKTMIHSLLLQKKGHVRVVPVILRPVNWETSPISTLPVLPANKKPVTKWRDHNDAFLRIVEAIHKIVLQQLLNPTENSALTEDALHYLNWLIKRTSSPDTRGISLGQRPFQVQLEEMYITLNAQYSEDVFQEQGSPFSLYALTAETSEQTHTLSLSDAVSRHDHLMLLGEPGSGKTTFLRYLALKHAQALCAQRDTEFGKAYFPLLLRIADYVKYGMHGEKSLSEYLAIECKSQVVTLFRSDRKGSCQERNPGARMISETQRHRRSALLIPLESPVYRET